ncbi:MAG: hypothetical protein ACTSRU_18285 [Candidatus Hodarchaeales archaeon]
MENDVSEHKYRIPFNRISIPMIIIFSIFYFFFIAIWYLLNEQDIIGDTGNLMLLMFFFCLTSFALFLLFISGNGMIELSIDENKLLLKRQFKPFHLPFMEFTSNRLALVKNIKQVETTKIRFLHPGYLLVSMITFVFTSVLLVDRIIFQSLPLNEQLLVIAMILALLTLLMLAFAIIQSRKYRYFQVMVRFGTSFPFLHPLEFLYGSFFSSGLWVIRGQSGDARALYDEFLTILNW